MSLSRCGSLAFAAFFTVSVAAFAAGEHLRTEVSLAGGTIGVTYAPTLSAADPAHQAVVSAAGATTARVRVAVFETNVPVQIGGSSFGRRSATPVQYDAWLEAASGAWLLELADAKDPKARPIRVPLERQALSAPSAQLVAALVPESGRHARLVLRWGAAQASTDVAVAETPRPAAQVAQAQRAAGAQPAQASQGRLVNRAHDADNSAAARTRLLGQRNETAMVLPGDRRLSVSYPQSFAKSELAANGTVRSGGLSLDGPDFARLSSTADGAVVTLTQAAVPRLVIDVPLRFGATTIRTENQVPGFPGAYGLWLKRAGNGWHLVFNNEPDVWGSQHNPKTDAFEIALQHAEDAGAAARPFSVALIPDGATRGRLLIVWGVHQWSAPFVTG
jgi:hypothetical protein